MNEPLVKRKQALLSEAVIVDPFEAINFEEKHYELFTEAELKAAVGTGLVFDCECYVNYFIIAFKHVETKRVIYFEDSPDSTINLIKLSWILNNFWIVGFNSRFYDLPLLTMAMLGYRAPALKEISNAIIYEELKQRDFEQKYNVKIGKYNHVDLIEVAPLMASLKIYGGRLHCQRMQELPIHHAKDLTEREAKAVKLYCINDLDTTIDLLLNLIPQLQLRHSLSQEYQTDLMSKSDAQIAEAVIVSELRRLNGYYPKKAKVDSGASYKYQVPSYITYETEQFQQMLEIVRNADFTIGAGGYTDMPDELAKLKLRLGSCVYQMGMGGLHSTETCIAHHADENTLLIDKDVASYYPAIILNLELYPKHLGKSFLKVYRSIVNRRLEAKKNGNKVVADSLKITINGSFGKLGNYYSALYAPDLMVQVTVTGQLALLKLIELLEVRGIRVVSANTDGILIKCHKDEYPTMQATVIYWQQITGFETEETKYRAVYSRDVNNYIAIKEDGEAKVKGAYAEKGSGGNTVLSKNPESLICNDAVIAFLAHNIPISQTILACKDIRRFVSVRNVKGGAEKSGVYLGRAVRWYFSKQIKGEINYLTTGNKVPKTDNAKPLMDLPKELPEDIDYEKYINISEQILHEIGYYETEKPLTLAF